MEPSPSVDLSIILALGGGIPMFKALESNGSYTATLRNLRLVSKEISLRSLHGLKCHTLTLIGDSKDTDVMGAVLLQGARLRELTVYLQLTNSYSPSYHVRKFLAIARPALASVKSLNITLEDISDRGVTEAEFAGPIIELLSACPALQTLTSCNRQLPWQYLQHLGDICPLLTALHVLVSADDQSDLEKMLQLQPCIFPRVQHLALYGEDYCFPGMTNNVSIKTLSLHGVGIESESDWLHLPPQLQHLECDRLEFVASPPADSSCNAAVLASLLSFTILEDAYLSLNSVAQLLRKAPCLRAIKAKQPFGSHFPIECHPDLNTAADISIVKMRSDIELIRSARYILDFNGGEDSNTAWLRSLIAAVPCFKGITHVGVRGHPVADVGLLLAALPDLQNLEVCLGRGAGTDFGLFKVAGCANLLTLTIQHETSVTPEGILALCMHLPKLQLVCFQGFRRPTQSYLDECALMVREYGMSVKFMLLD